ncbi:MAG: GNAT family N-acetyltransferase [candidate division KSB1 bacterium]|nr:GNAT family N-acetyltransferase [candidate division KSB1 bacterium]MDZ7367333.1 GNAT family N-acetyltransferase [candidate division KSB1 bacterium]
MAVLQIQTRRLNMRPFTMNEVDALHRLWTDPHVRKYLWDDIVISQEQAAAVVESSIASFAQRGFGFWAMFPKDRDEVIGFCGFRLFDDPPEVEILYGVNPEYWGKGLATEASQALLRCGFEEHGFERIYAGADPPNAASFRVMEKCGMTFAKRMIINNIEVIYYVISREAF